MKRIVLLLLFLSLVILLRDASADPIGEEEYETNAPTIVRAPTLLYAGNNSSTNPPTVISTLASSTLNKPVLLQAMFRVESLDQTGSKVFFLAKDFSQALANEVLKDMTTKIIVSDVYQFQKIQSKPTTTSLETGRLRNLQETREDSDEDFYLVTVKVSSTFAALESLSNAISALVDVKIGNKYISTSIGKPISYILENSNQIVTTLMSGGVECGTLKVTGSSTNCEELESNYKSMQIGVYVVSAFALFFVCLGVGFWVWSCAGSKQAERNKKRSKSTPIETSKLNDPEKHKSDPQDFEDVEKKLSSSQQEPSIRSSFKRSTSAEQQSTSGRAASNRFSQRFSAQNLVLLGTAGNAISNKELFEMTMTVLGKEYKDTLDFSEMQLEEGLKEWRRRRALWQSRALRGETQGRPEKMSVTFVDEVLVEGGSSPNRRLRAPSPNKTVQKLPTTPAPITNENNQQRDVLDTNVIQLGDLSPEPTDPPPPVPMNVTTTTTTTTTTTAVAQDNLLTPTNNPPIKKRAITSIPLQTSASSSSTCSAKSLINSNPTKAVTEANKDTLPAILVVNENNNDRVETHEPYKERESSTSSTRSRSASTTSNGFDIHQLAIPPPKKKRSGSTITNNTTNDTLRNRSSSTITNATIETVRNRSSSSITNGVPLMMTTNTDSSCNSVAALSSETIPIEKVLEPLPFMSESRNRVESSISLISEVSTTAPIAPLVEEDEENDAHFHDIETGITKTNVTESKQIFETETAEKKNTPDLENIPKEESVPRAAIPSFRKEMSMKIGAEMAGRMKQKQQSESSSKEIGGEEEEEEEEIPGSSDEDDQVTHLEPVAVQEQQPRKPILSMRSEMIKKIAVEAATKVSTRRLTSDNESKSPQKEALVTSSSSSSSSIEVEIIEPELQPKPTCSTTASDESFIMEVLPTSSRPKIPSNSRRNPTVQRFSANLS